MILTQVSTDGHLHFPEDDSSFEITCPDEVGWTLVLECWGSHRGLSGFIHHTDVLLGYCKLQCAVPLPLPAARQCHGLAAAACE